MMNEQELLDDQVEETPEVVEEEPSEQEQPEPVTEEPEKKREDHPNFRKMREQNDALFQRNNELQESLRRLEEKLTADAEQFEDPETRRIKKLETKLEKLEREKQEQEMQRKMTAEVQQSHEVLGDIYEDFGQIYTRDNVNDFYDKYPSIERRAQQKARAMGYEEAAEYTYMRMKEKGYGKKQIQEAVKEARIEKNSQKPQRASVMGQVASAQNESTAEYKARIRAEADRIIKGY